MPTELTNIQATHVSYVRKGANKKPFFFMKSDNEPNFEKEFRIFISKSEAEKKLVYGIVYEPDSVDTQGEFAKAEAIEKAAHDFLANCRNIDLQHNFETGIGTVVESYIAPSDFKIEQQEIKKGAWVLVTKASDEVWEEIKKGTITGYSMAGVAEKVADGSIKKNDDSEVKGFMNTLKAYFSGDPIAKSGKAISNANAKKLKAAHDALSELLMLESANQNNNNKEGDDINMEKQELTNILKSVLDEAIKPLNDKLDAIEKQDTPTPEPEVAAPTDPAVEAAELAAVIKSAISEAIKPVEDRLMAIEKSKGVSRQAFDDIAKSATNKSVFAGLNII